jgi:hypothetical protein
MVSHSRSSSLYRLAWLFPSLSAVALGQACANRADDRDANSTHTPPGGTSNAGATATAGKAGNPAGGTSGAGDAGAPTAGTNMTAGAGGTIQGGAAGEGGSMNAPCDDACSVPTPICNETTDTCVECLAPADCTTGAKDKCDAASNTCVECLEAADCGSPTAARCDGGACVKCESNDDCTHIAGKTVCDTAAGECVQCTGKDYASCGSDMGTPLVCDSLLRTCTTNKKASAGLCKPCVADDQCTAGKLCVQEQFGSPAQDVGYFCFWQQGDTANGAPEDCFSGGRPYADILNDQISIDGVTADICGLRSSTCIARNQFSSKDCATSSAADDTKCGFDAGEDSKCTQASPSQYRCTMTCGSDDDCPIGFACDTGANPPVCEL